MVAAKSFVLVKSESTDIKNEIKTKQKKIFGYLRESRQSELRLISCSYIYLVFKLLNFNTGISVSWPVV